MDLHDIVHRVIGGRPRRPMAPDHGSTVTTEFGCHEFAGELPRHPLDGMPQGKTSHPTKQVSALFACRGGVTTPHQALAAAGHASAVELRTAGLTYDQIATELGYANRGTV